MKGGRLKESLDLVNLYFEMNLSNEEYLQWKKLRESADTNLIVTKTIMLPNKQGE